MRRLIQGGLLALVAALLLPLPVRGQDTAPDTAGDGGGNGNAGPAEGCGEAQDKGDAEAKSDGEGGNANGGPEAGAAAQVPAVPGFVWIPTGPLQPGCTAADAKQRASGDAQLKEVLQWEVWGTPPQVEVPGFYFGRFEVTNAQWKLYLDRNFRVEHTTSGQESLEDLAARYVKFRGKGIESEWQAVYAFNWEVIVPALQQAQAKEDAAARKAENPQKAFEDVQGKFWDSAWKPENPAPDPNNPRIARIKLPKGLKLVLYSHRTPSHWYGWCRLAGLNVGREYCDIRKAPENAFIAPDTEEFKALKLRDTDFGAYPIRDISINEALDFAEWTGCELASEYEWERAARGSRPNTEQYTFPGTWARNQQKGIIAWVDNSRCNKGPLRVDDDSVAKSDSAFGARHMLGNVAEMLRTLYDKHPHVTPEPPDHPDGLFNYAHLIKGGNWGDRWQFLTISFRTGQYGKAIFAERFNNRVDSVGIRLVRHPVRGYDLLQQSIWRLAYNPGGANWNRILPHAYALPRAGGVDEVHLTPAEAPYVHAKDKATAIAFAPLWLTELTKATGLPRKKVDGREYAILGALRSDVPIHAGVRLLPNEIEKLRADRAAYEKALKEHRKWEKLAKRRQAETPEPVVPPEPPAPDEYEKLTEKLPEGIGVWQGKAVEPGEWIVVYWYGFLGLANKTLVMPPDAILMLDPKKISSNRKPPQRATVQVNPANDEFILNFWVEQQPEPRRPQSPPETRDSKLWALCEVWPDGWPGRKPGKDVWTVEIKIPTEKGELAKHDWK